MEQSVIFDHTHRINELANSLKHDLPPDTYKVVLGQLRLELDAQQQAETTILEKQVQGLPQHESFLQVMKEIHHQEEQMIKTVSDMERLKPTSFFWYYKFQRLQGWIRKHLSAERKLWVLMREIFSPAKRQEIETALEGIKSTLITRHLTMAEGG